MGTQRIGGAEEVGDLLLLLRALLYGLGRKALLLFGRLC